MKQIMQKLIGLLGYRISPIIELSQDIESEFWEFFKLCRPYTMTSQNRMYSMYQAVKYVILAKVLGDIVECGVWRGGNAMLAGLVCKSLQESDRQIYLYDTYTGMAEPDSRDVDFRDNPAAAEWNEKKTSDGSDWCLAGLDEVKRNLASIKIPESQLQFVQGKVEDTIPGKMPKQISVLRLDTDWFSSTYHELVYLYPLLSPGGILIIDDYGYWKGAREATDTYFAENGIVPLLTRIDHTGRMMVKCGGDPHG